MTGSKDEGRMTTANEPSVAELVDQVRTCELNDFQAEETADLLAQAFARLERRCEMLQVEVGTLQGVSASLRGNRNVQRVLDLERRCAKMERPWVPVSERQPKRSAQRYEVTARGMHGIDDIYVGYYFVNSGWSVNESRALTVIAWRELSKPYLPPERANEEIETP